MSRSLASDLASIFVLEINTGLQSCFRCIRQINYELTVATKPDAESLFFWTHTLLMHSAQISSIFWPTESKYEKRGAELRLLIDEDSANVLKNRSIRNDIVHKDERLHKWYEKSEYGNVADKNIGPRAGLSAFTGFDMIEYFITDETVFLFRGREYDLQKLAYALDKINRALNLPKTK
ncbi:hypothetical protein [Loktanella sp. R86503]|uniref:hypothetical protein n=1 Tax=Loktanella sp. R86503 TaxID=3093847 RepID=UPI0036DE4DEF